MGQYYYVVNLSKKQFIHPHKFGDGLKLLEFGCSGSGTMLGLAILLADGNGRGGGDLNTKSDVVGSWAGDRIVISGDYADPGKFCPKMGKKALTEIAKKHYSEGYQQPERVNLQAIADETFEDISVKVLAALMDDQYICKSLEMAAAASYGDSPIKKAVKEVKMLKKLVS
jgi:hypothetical protein